MLSEIALKTFKDAYVEEFGVEISDEEAARLGISLLSLFDHIYRPVRKKWLEDAPDRQTTQSND